MHEQPPWMRAVALPLATCAVATLITWRLWPYIAPSASPLFFVAVMISSLYGGIVAGTDRHGPVRGFDRVLLHDAAVLSGDHVQ